MVNPILARQAAGEARVDQTVKEMEGNGAGRLHPRLNLATNILASKSQGGRTKRPFISLQPFSLTQQFSREYPWPVASV